MARNMFISTHNRWFFRWAFLASLTTLAVILSSAYLQVADMTSSSVPQIQKLQHHLLQAVGIFIALLTFLAWQFRKALTLRPLLICTGLILFAASGLAMNKWGIRLNVPPLLLLSNLLFSFLILSLLWWTTLITRPNAYSAARSVNPFVRALAWIGLVIIFLQTILCDWYGQSLLDLDWQNLIAAGMPVNKVTNSLLAMIQTFYEHSHSITPIYLGAFSLILLLNRQLASVGLLMLVLIILQTSVNHVSFTWLQPPWIALSYNAAALLLLLAVITVLTNLYRKPQDYW